LCRLQKNKIPSNLWEILESMKPFKVLPIEYVSDTKID